MTNLAGQVSVRHDIEGKCSLFNNKISPSAIFTPHVDHRVVNHFPSSHHDYVTSPTTSVPPKCSDCGVELHPAVVLEKQVELMQARTFLHNNDCVVNMPLYIEVREYTFNEGEPMRIDHLGLNRNIKRVFGDV
jgi:hypothetical protein